MMDGQTQAGQQDKFMEEVRRLLNEELPPTPRPATNITDPFRNVPNYQIPVVTDGNVRAAKKRAGIGWKEKMKLNRNPFTTYLITMFFGNGTCEHFVVDTKQNFFTHGKGKRYHLDKTMVLWDANEKQNRLYYHQDYVEPLQFKTIISEGGDETYAYITPQNLEPIIKMEFVRLIAEGPELSKMVRIMLFLSIVTLGLLLIIVIIFLAQSGIFQQLSGSLQGAVS